MHVLKHDHFSLYVADLKRSARWYQDVLGLEPRHVDTWWGEHQQFFGYGEALVALFARRPNESYSSAGMPVCNHQAFRVTRDSYEAFKQSLAAKHIAFQEMGHVISNSIYFQDPDDYWIELTTYEVGERT